MERIRQRLLDESAGIKRGEDKRREREGKKFGKQVQIEKLKERERGKKEMEERLKGLKRSTFYIYASIIIYGYMRLGVQNVKAHWTMLKQTMTVSTLLSKMQFRTIPQNEEKGRAAAKSVVHPETRNSDSVEQGRDQSRMIGPLLTISIPGLVKVAEAVSVVVDEVEAAGEAEEGEVVAEEVAAVNGLAKTSGCLRAIDPDFGGFSR
jgi:hypothetical protein